MIIFDIETEPLPDDELIARLPAFTPPAPPSEFDPATVKLGNLKDEAKRAAKIKEARADHAALAANHDATILAAKEAWLADAREKAALSAATGRVLAIGYFSIDKKLVTVDSCGLGDPAKYEPTLIIHFWEQYKRARIAKPSPRPLIGLNIHEFDLPFLVRRSWILGIDVPPTVLRDDRYWDSLFIDLRKRWLCGQWGAGNGTKSSFDSLAAAFGTGGKFEGRSGSEFATLWRQDRDKAIAYLQEDLRQPAEWAKRMGILA